MSPAARKAGAKKAIEPILALGDPSGLAFGLPIEALREGPAVIEAELKGATVQQVIVFGATTPDPEHVHVQVQVDPTTAPGRYDGVARVGKAEFPIAAEVTPRLLVRSTPARIELTAAPRESISVDVKLFNVGNVPADVPASSTFTLLNRSGFGDALWHAISEEPPPDKQRVDVLFDDLADSHGGEVEVRATKLKAPVKPGETGEVTITMTFSNRLQAGQEYAGSWNIDALRIPVRVVAAAATSTPKKAEVA